MFAGKMMDLEVLVQTFYAFLVFCFLASGIYFINDIVDAPKDRMHPIKKNRPIASGKLSVGLAWVVAGGLLLGSLTASLFFVGTYYTLALVGYVLIQFSYSLYFRNVIILDSLIVASGFVIRVFAGGLASNTSISSWLALTTIGISLLLAFGKRRSEKTIVAKYAQENLATASPNTTGAVDNTSSRKTLRHYPDTLLDSMISMSATYTLITYSLFTFQISPQVVSKKLAHYLPSILSNPKWMMATIPLVIYGVARYLYVIYEKNEAESPERVLLSDKPLLITVVLWGSFTLLVYYLLPYLS